MIKKENVTYNCNLHLDVFENDNLINSIDKNNLLMDTGKLVLFEAMCNPSPLYGNVSSMIFGDSDVAATVSDNTTSFGSYHINDTTGYVLDLVNYDNVKIYWQLIESEFNGKTLKTIGLIGSNRTYNYIFNRINLMVGEYIVKTPYIKVTGYWQIFLT